MCLAVEIRGKNFLKGRHTPRYSYSKDNGLKEPARVFQLFSGAFPARVSKC